MPPACIALAHRTRSDPTDIHFFGPNPTRPLTQLFAMRFTTAFRVNPCASTYTSTTLRIVPVTSAAFSPAVDPYLCETAAVTAAPPASITRTADADSDARMIAAESTACPRVFTGGCDGAAAVAAGEDDCGCDWGWGGGGVREGAREPEGDLLCPRCVSGGLSSEEEAERDWRGTGRVGMTDDDDDDDCVEARPLPLSVPTCWISLSTAAAALLLSFTAPPLTAWTRVRCFRVVWDCRRRSVRDGSGVLEPEPGLGLELELGFGVDVDGAVPSVAWGDGVECEM